MRSQRPWSKPSTRRIRNTCPSPACFETLEVRTHLAYAPSAADQLICLDQFRADQRFSSIDGAGYAAVIIDDGLDRDHPFFGPDANRNGVADRVQGLAADALPAVLAVDLILANILAPALVQLAPRLLAALRPGGTVVLSGLLEAQVPQVVAAFTPAVHFAAPAIEQGWACLAGVKS